jgi:lysophospholipase L1-like esterase
MAAFHPGDRILFQGDSITDGGRQRVGDDLNHIMGQDYAYIIAARVGAELPERRLVFLNRGISGNRITDLRKRWQTDTLDMKPDILSILVGVNDGTSVVDKRPSPDSVADYAAIYDTLISQTLASLPHVRLILCEPFAFPGGGRTKERWPERQLDLQERCKAVEALGAKYHIPVVHFQKVFDAACLRAPASTWIWDGIHPTYAGHELMADEWLRVFTAAYGP